MFVFRKLRGRRRAVQMLFIYYFGLYSFLPQNILAHHRKLVLFNFRIKFSFYPFSPFNLIKKYLFFILDMYLYLVYIYIFVSLSSVSHFQSPGSFQYLWYEPENQFIFQLTSSITREIHFLFNKTLKKMVKSLTFST